MQKNTAQTKVHKRRPIIWAMTGCNAIEFQRLLVVFSSQFHNALGFAVLVVASKISCKNLYFIT